MNTIELDLGRWRTLARIGHAAAQDPEDGILVGVRFQLRGGLLVATANNRYVSARNTVTVSGGGADFTGAVVARQAMLVEKDIRSLERYRSRKDHPDLSIMLRVDLADEWIEVTLAADGSLLEPESISRRMDLLDGTYPEVGDIFDKALDVPPPERHGRLAANPEYLTMVSKTIGWEDLGSVLVYLNPPANDDRTPMVVRCPADAAWSGLVMPVRLPE